MPVLQDAYMDVGGRATLGAFAEQKPVTKKLLLLEVPISHSDHDVFKLSSFNSIYLLLCIFC